MDALLVSKKTGTSERTRRALILAGEKLFGEQGIDGVSLRQINTAAGQKNSSAAHYHFGSREALMRAIYEYRMESVNSRRLEMLAQLKTDHRENDIRAIVETIVYPIVEEIEDSEGGSHYIRFLAQMMGHPRLVLDALWSSRFAEGLSSVVQLLKHRLPEIPAPLLYQRFGLMWEQTIHALADQEKISSGGHNGAGRPANHSSIFVSNLVDTVAGGLSAPVSTATLAQLNVRKNN